MRLDIVLPLTLALRVSAAAPASAEAMPGVVLIPAGQFEMGDHHGFVDPKHGGDETPIHTVRLDAFCRGIYTVTTKEYCDFLNSALAAKQIGVREGGVFLAGGRPFAPSPRARAR
jgi:formylglycine-generating enzyme required for sulfatase activity